MAALTFIIFLIVMPHTHLHISPSISFTPIFPYPPLMRFHAHTHHLSSVPYPLNSISSFTLIKPISLSTPHHPPILFQVPFTFIPSTFAWPCMSMHGYAILHALRFPCVHTHNPTLLYTSPVIIIPISPFVLFFLIPLNPFPLITSFTYSAFAHHKFPHFLSLIHMTCKHDLFDTCMTSLDPLISQVCKCVRVMN